MRKIIRTCVAASLVIASFASWAADQGAPNKYSSIYVSKVVVEADMDRNSSDEVKYYADIETDATSKISKWFKDEGYVIADTPDPESEGQLIINTKVKFNAGNRALRWIGGIGGAGKATADVTMEAITSKSGKLVTSKNAHDSLRMGGFGGSAPGMLMGTIDSAWNYVVADLNERKNKE